MLAGKVAFVKNILYKSVPPDKILFEFTCGANRFPVIVPPLRGRYIPVPVPNSLAMFVIMVSNGVEPEK